MTQFRIGKIRDAAARDRVRVVMVGLNFGAYLLPEMIQGAGSQHIEVCGVCDLDSHKAAQVSDAFGVRAYAGLDQVLADPNVEAVGLFTGPAGRAGLIEQIIRSGRHVLTTKPFERDATAALAVLREAQRLGKAVIINSPAPLPPPDLAQVETWTREFDLGRPVAARFDVWASYQETADGRWHDDPELCPVAPIFRIGIYLINDAVQLFGEAVEVQTLSSRVRTDRPTPDNAQLGIRFRSGALANIFASFCIDDGDAHRNAMTLNYERGTIYRNCGPFQSVAREGDSEMVLVRRGHTGREVSAQVTLPRYHPQMAYQWETFYRLVRGDQTLTTVTPETVAAGIRIIEAMTRAGTNGGSAIVFPILSDTEVLDTLSLSSAFARS